MKLIHFYRFVKPLVLMVLLQVVGFLCLSDILLARVGIKKVRIPNFNSAVKATGFFAIGIDGRTHKLCLSNGSAWSEISYSGGINTANAFIAPTRGYSIEAIASAPGGVYVYDSVNHVIMSGQQRYKLDTYVGEVTGMTFCEGYIYLCTGSGDVYKLALESGKAEVVFHKKIRPGLCAMASYGTRLFMATPRAIYLYNTELIPVKTYYPAVSISGLAAVSESTLIAVSADGGYLYEIEL